MLPASGTSLTGSDRPDSNEAVPDYNMSSGQRFVVLPHGSCHLHLASPVIIGPVAMLGFPELFLEPGGTDEGQTVYRKPDHSDIAQNRQHCQ